MYNNKSKLLLFFLVQLNEIIKFFLLNKICNLSSLNPPRTGYIILSQSTDGLQRKMLTSGSEGISVLAYDWLSANLYWGGVESFYVAPVANMSKIVTLPLKAEAM